MVSNFSFHEGQTPQDRPSLPLTEALEFWMGIAKEEDKDLPENPFGITKVAVTEDQTSPVEIHIINGPLEKREKISLFQK